MSQYSYDEYHRMAEMMSSCSPATSPPSVDAADHLISTGYLEDVLFQFSSNSKKRRSRLQQPLLDDYTNTPPQILDDTSSSIKECCWTSDLFRDYDTLADVTKRDINYSDYMKTPEEEAISESYYDSSSSSQKELPAGNYQWTPEKENQHFNPIFSFVDMDHEVKRKKRLLAKVVCPFALVKPGGFEGGMTLNDINERILMPPTRPVRHPVGEFACRPLVSRDGGTGLSGKAVVAFTRIQTHGKGTITIVRTRG